MSRARLALACAALALTAPGLAASPAGAAMKSVKLADGTCETTGGGRFVPIPGFPGERIDRRLLADLAWLERRYPIFITDGYSLDPVHAANGEHPLGLAVDVVPDKANGGTWADITALALWAEPRQDHPIFPFRWVGYKGDPNHGPRNHLHLSWAHSDATKGPGHPVRTVYTLRCPTSLPTQPTTPPEGGTVPEEPPTETGQRDGERRHRHHRHHHHRHHHHATDTTTSGGVKSDGGSSGGIGTRLKLAPVVPETE